MSFFLLGVFAKPAEEWFVYVKVQFELVSAPELFQFKSFWIVFRVEGKIPSFFIESLVRVFGVDLFCFQVHHIFSLGLSQEAENLDDQVWHSQRVELDFLELFKVDEHTLLIYFFGKNVNKHLEIHVFVNVLLFVLRDNDLIFQHRIFILSSNILINFQISWGELGLEIIRTNFSPFHFPLQ